MSGHSNELATFGPISASLGCDVFALVTENIDVGTVVSSVGTEGENGKSYSLETQHVVTCGLAIVLSEMEN